MNAIQLNSATANSAAIVAIIPNSDYNGMIGTTNQLTPSGKITAFVKDNTPPSVIPVVTQLLPSREDSALVDEGYDITASLASSSFA
jgi:hypothetical protein